jgi:Tfp pilus assembly protein PilP
MKEFKKTYFLILFLTCVLVNCSLLGQAIAKTGAMPAGVKVQNKTLEKLFWFSGLNNRYLDVESALEQYNNIDPQALKPSQTGFAKNLMRRGDGTSHIRANLKKSFRKRFSQEHTEASMKWFNSRTGRKILKAESEAISPENEKDRGKFAKDIMNVPPGESRLMVVERIESAGTLSSNIKSLYLAYVEAMFPFNNLLQGKRLVKVVRMLKDEVIEPIREQVLHQKLFAYRNISVTDLKDYADFLESSAGRWFVLSEMQGFTQGIKKTLHDVDKVQRELLIEIDEGGPEFPLLRELAPPGQRYLLVQLRDPFQPLFTDEGPVERPKAPSLSSARQFGNELESIPPIALYVMRKIETKRPELFRKMKHYEHLFNNKEDLEAMSDDEYADAVEAYRTILEKASETKVPKNSLQLEYANLRLTGIISKNSKTLALIETSDNKGYAVGKGDVIGPKFGFVDQIQSEKIIVIEKSRDYLGNILTRQKTIEFSQKI